MKFRHLLWKQNYSDLFSLMEYSPTAMEHAAAIAVLISVKCRILNCRYDTFSTLLHGLLFFLLFLSLATAHHCTESLTAASALLDRFTVFGKELFCLSDVPVDLATPSSQILEVQFFAKKLSSNLLSSTPYFPDR